MAGQDLLSKAAVTIQMQPTKFSTGSDGFRGQGKVMDGEAKYQVQVIAVRVGSKPASTKNGKK